MFIFYEAVNFRLSSFLLLVRLIIFFFMLFVSLSLMAGKNSKDNIRGQGTTKKLRSSSVPKAKVSKAKVSKAKVSKAKVSKDKVSKDKVSKDKVSKDKVTRILTMLSNTIGRDEVYRFNLDTITEHIQDSTTADELISALRSSYIKPINAFAKKRKSLNEIFQETMNEESRGSDQSDVELKSIVPPKSYKRCRSSVSESGNYSDSDSDSDSDSGSGSGSGSESDSSGRVEADKPMIYLYPEIGQEVLLSVEFDGVMTSLYPEYNFNNQWRVWAEPDGTLKDPEKDRIYYGLYWEGEMKQAFEIESGFVIAGSETAQFLEEKLKLLGLSDKEANEMIVYWLPRMQGNDFNLIHFQTVQYAEQVTLNVHPKPDMQIRIMMLFKPLDAFIEIQEQTLPEKPVERKGFVLVEWGGSEIKASGHSVIE